MSDPSLDEQNLKPRVVLKIGTNSLIEESRMAVGTMAQLVEICTTLRQRGFEVVIVSSGAVGVGCNICGLTTKPDDIAMKQATAAVGQIRLMRMWGDLFAAADVICGQVLLTYDNLGELVQHKSASNTFNSLLKIGVIPIVNENDTTATFSKRRRFGDNDRLSAQVTSLVGAEWLFLLTDVDAVYTANPKDNPDARRIGVAHDIDELAALVDTGEGAGSAFSTGGMATKLTAARIASASGCRTVILNAKSPENILKFCTERAAELGPAYEAAEDGIKAEVGTVVLPKGQQAETDRQRWIVGLKPEGEVVTTIEGAQRLANNEPLLAADIIEVRGDFPENTCVSIRVQPNETNPSPVSVNPVSPAQQAATPSATPVDQMQLRSSSKDDVDNNTNGNGNGENHEDPNQDLEREVAIGVVNFKSNSWRDFQHMSQEDLTAIETVNADNIVTTMNVGGGSHDSQENSSELKLNNK